MIQTNGGDGRQNRLTNIGTVETATHAYFHNDHIWLLCRKIIKSHGRYQFELCQTEQGLIRTISFKQIPIQSQIIF